MKQISLLPAVMKGEDIDDLERQVEQFREYDKTKRKQAMKIEPQFYDERYKPRELRELTIKKPKQRYIAKFDLEKHYPNLKGDLEKMNKKFVEAGRELAKACDTAAGSYARAFGAAAKSLPGWTVDQEHWNYNPNPEEIKTREKAFEGICKRRKKGKVVRR